jgi:polysaccharide pyruvyl transferase WcaK-like protein
MKVTVSGYYGFGNTGDEAIALAITREWRAR